MTSKTVFVTRVQADHPRAQGFNKRLEAMMLERELLTKLLNEEATVCANAIEKVYTYNVRSAFTEGYLPQQVRDNGAIRVVRVWANKEEWVHLAKRYGLSKIGTDAPKTVCSVVYYRLKGTLLAHASVGVQLLRTNVECGDYEWSLITRSMVPTSFLNLAS